MKRTHALLTATLLSCGMLLGMAGCGKTDTSSASSGGSGASQVVSQNTSDSGVKTASALQTASAPENHLTSADSPSSSQEASAPQTEISEQQSYVSPEETFTSEETQPSLPEESRLVSEETEDSQEEEQTVQESTESQESDAVSEESSVASEDSQSSQAAETSATAFVGKWTLHYDLSDLSKEEAEEIQPLLNPVSMELVVKKDGTATFRQIVYGKVDQKDGTWTNEDTILYVVIEDSRQAFQLKKDKLYMEFFEYGYFTK